MSHDVALPPAAARTPERGTPSAAMPCADASVRIEFRALARSDFELLHGWLRDPQIARWYSSGAPTRAAVRRKYEPRVAGRSATRVYIVRVDARDAGLAQTYPVAAYPGFARALGAGPGWAGLDYFIGERELRGKRLAHRIVAAFVDEIVTAVRGIDVCAALPAHDNVKSVRTLERAGFRGMRRIELTPGQADLLMVREVVTGHAGGTARACGSHRHNVAARGRRR